MPCTRSFIFVLLLGAVTIVHARLSARRHVHAARAVTPWEGPSKYHHAGLSGVAAMQLAVVDNDHVILFDRAEHNPVFTANGNNAWSALLRIHEEGNVTVRPLKLKTNSFCAGGGWLSNGTLLNYGGTSQSNIPSGNGYQGLRMFTPLPDGRGHVFEEPHRIHLTTHRWYPSSTRLSDGSQIIFGGARLANFNDYNDNPTLEFFPPKGTGHPIHSPFLKDALPSNLFPHIFALPNNHLFLAANTLAMTYDWVHHVETRLPDLPNGVRVNYPWSAGAVLLPLTPENHYKPEVLLCGGSTIDDTLPPSELSSQTPASNQCARMKLTPEGIAAGWEVESMPGNRLMIDAIVMPDGNVLLINGAATGMAGYANVPDVIGQSNADHPVLTPWLYKPSAPAGSRFTTGFATSKFPRMYHSSASLLPDGSVMVAGSNPNGDVSTVKYVTQYHVEYFRPPYYSMPRPSYTGAPEMINYGQEFEITVSLADLTANKVKAVIMDLGFHTHGVSLDSRYVGLVSTYDTGTGQLSVTGPPNARIYPPGPAWLYVVVDGVPSKGTKVMIGTGANPPSSATASEGALEYSKKLEASASYRNQTYYIPPYVPTN